MLTEEWRSAPDGARQEWLLLWLAESNGFRSLDRADIYADDSDAAKARHDLDDLQGRGLVTTAFDGGGSLETLNAIVTPVGRRQAGELSQRRGDTAARRWTCRSALVAWLYDEDAIGSMEPRDWRQFVRTARAFYCGDKFNLVEVAQAMSWLQNRQLIDGPNVEEQEAPASAYLTDEGICCAEDYDTDVRRYGASSSPSLDPSQIVNTYNVYGGTNQFAAGPGSQQTMTISQLSEQLIGKIDSIVETVRGAGLIEGRESELHQLVENARNDVSTRNSDMSAVRRFVGWVLASLRQGASAAVVAAVTSDTTELTTKAEKLLHLLH